MISIARHSLAALGAFALLTGPAYSQALNAEQARRLVDPFYQLLNQPATKDVKALGEQAIPPDWRSYASETDYKGREEFIRQVTGLGKLVPDLAWNIKEVLVDGDRIVVRSEATGTPAGPFMGVTPNGRSFRIMAIDIHTVRDGKLMVGHHVEDWAGLIRQVSQKP